MKYRVILQPRAAQNLAEQYQHIAQQNPAAAANWFNRFVSAIEGLALFPERCAIARESEFVGTEIRQFLFGNRRAARRVFFVIVDDTVRILAIRHSAQSGIDPQELFDE